MRESDDIIVYRLHKKGVENYTDFDRLIIESNPVVKEELKRLSGVSEESYQAARSLLREKVEKRRGRSFSLLPISTVAACLVTIFSSLFIYYSRAPVTLGESATLYVSSQAAPDSFYSRGSTFEGGEELTLSFLPDSEAAEPRQGVLFSIDDRLESVVYYRYDSSRGSLDHLKPTRLEQTVRMEAGREYIYFFLLFSEEEFDEKARIEQIKEIVKKRKLKADRALVKELKGYSYAYTILRRKNIDE